LEIYLLSYEINEQVHASCCLMNRFTDHVQFCEAVQPSSFKKDPTQKPFVHRYTLRQPQASLTEMQQTGN